ncbi:MAG: hypothetical protein KAH04_07935, partial [Psychrilyobacter sp.]|nr:hypothetical protein [Psychrilyobacter sp.]
SKVYNYGKINLNKENGIGMEADGTGAEAYNYGTINLSGTQVGNFYEGTDLNNLSRIGLDSKGNVAMKAVNGGKIVNKGKITFTTK